jgi:hypothetical protein
MGKAEDNLRDVQKIYDEIEFYKSKTPKDFAEGITLDKDAIRYTVYDFSGRIFICGFEASMKFYNLANRHLDSYPENKQKFDFNDFVKNLHGVFLEFFVHEGREITSQSVNKLLVSTDKRSRRKLQNLTHYIPCNIFHSSTIPEFQIGPIKFLHETRFDELYLNEIEELRTTIAQDHQVRCQELISRTSYVFSNVASPEQSKDLANRLVDGLLSAWNSYEWIAVIKIDGYMPTVSYEKAVLSTKTALNILKLILGGYYTNRIRLGSDDMEPLKGATLSRKEGERLDISLSSTARSKPIGDQWLEILQTVYADYLEISVKAIDTIISFEKTPPLCERFLDALSWYGDAVTESSEAAKIVKFVSAIERMAGTGKTATDDNAQQKRTVTDIIISRASILYSNASDETISDSIQKVTRVYAQRSDLVHGSISPLEVCANDAAEAENIARFVLLSGLDFFHILGFSDESMNKRKLKEDYENLEQSVVYSLDIHLQQILLESYFSLLRRPLFCLVFLECCPDPLN